jgi:DNA-binding protein HU-beta
MKKSDVVARLRALGLNKSQAEGVLEALAALTASALGQGERAVLDGIGSFTVKARAARVGRNPKTGEKIDVPARKVVQFKAAPALKAAVDG